MTNINSDVLTTDVLKADVLKADVLKADVLKADVLKAAVLNAAVLNAEPWRARLGAFNPRCGFLGTGVLGASGGTGPCIVVRSVPRVRDRVVIALPVPQPAPMAQLAQPNNYNHMTSAYAFGEGASGPPPDREPA